MVLTAWQDHSHDNTRLIHVRKQNGEKKKTVDGGSKKGSSSFHDLVSAF